MNKLNTKYSNIEFQHKRFGLLNGEIISKMPLWKIYSYIYWLRKFQKDQVAASKTANSKISLKFQTSLVQK